jgi:hypothetical protein
MSGMEGLGAAFNVLANADDIYVPLANAASVSFVCVNAGGDTYTLTEAKDAAGTSAAVLPTITRFYAQATNGAVWAEVTQAAASTFAPSSSQDVAVVTVSGVELSDTFTHVKLAATGAGTVLAILHGLMVQRAPANLPALV